MVIDSHVHCSEPSLFEREVRPELDDGGIGAAVLFPPVEEIYDRLDPEFEDTPAWRARRREANRRVLRMARERSDVLPYYFVWNDFDTAELSRGYCGIKWHRHEDEPIYRYEDEKCADFIEALTSGGLPVLLEESLPNTLRFVSHLAPGASVIIPHLGLLNGGYHALEATGLWSESRVYADTALAPVRTIGAFLDRYGADRLLFGSDYPFGQPEREIRKVRELGLSRADEEKVLGGTLGRLLKTFGSI